MIINISREESKMKIDVCSKNSVYIELNGWTYYIDDSTNEQIVEKYELKECPHCLSKRVDCDADGMPVCLGCGGQWEDE